MHDTPTLSVAECNELLSRLAATRAPSNSDVYIKTREYVAAFSRFKDGKAVNQVDLISSRLLGRGGIGQFERAQLGMSCHEAVMARSSRVEQDADDMGSHAMLRHGRRSAHAGPVAGGEDQR